MLSTGPENMSVGSRPSAGIVEPSLILTMTRRGTVRSRGGALRNSNLTTICKPVSIKGRPNMHQQEKLRSLWIAERRKLDTMLSDGSTDLEKGLIHSGRVVGLADGYIKFLEDALRAPNHST